MDAKLVRILDYYTEKFGGELIPKLAALETQGWHVVKEFEQLQTIKEDPKFHGDVTSFVHSLQVVNILQRIYGFIYLQEQHRKINVVALEQALSLLPTSLQDHLEKTIGNHKRQELLFFACIFHDIGKIKHFSHLMKDVEKENVKGITRFIFHADYGWYYFDDEMDELEKQMNDFEQKLQKEQNPIKQQFYQHALEYLHELKNEFEARRTFFEQLQITSAERKYLAFVIKNHMDLLNLYNQFLQAYKAREQKDGEKLLDSLTKNILKKVEEYGEQYLDCILLNFCDLLESAHSAKHPTEELYVFFHLCMLCFAKKDELASGGKIVFEENQWKVITKPKPAYTFSALFKTYPKDKALAIKNIVTENPSNPSEALKKAGYGPYEVEKILTLLKS
ncbi:MAG: hypothetical protein QW594_03395 [Candidatus Woesearchaeota archaeon]